MSVMQIPAEHLEEINAHLVETIMSNHKESTKMFLKMQNLYAIQFMGKGTAREKVEGIIEWFINRYAQINHIEYCMRCEKDIDIDASIKLDRKKKVKTISMVKAESILGSMQYNIGEYIQMGSLHMSFLNFLRELYKNCDEVKQHKEKEALKHQEIYGY